MPLTYNNYSIDAEIGNANREMWENDLSFVANEEVKVYSRDWTVQTICDQIIQGNIDLNPKFQRRNAWNDARRSLLIESLVLDLPVPEIVLAANNEEKGKFIVLDGKQRLLTLLGFIQPETTNYWDKPILTSLPIKQNLNGMSYEDLLHDENFRAEKRKFDNASIRCTVIFGHRSEDLLYQIFYRLNANAVPLSSHELRQSLRKGHFSDYLIEITNDIEHLQPIHHVLGLDEPDKRLLDAEIILKFIAFRLFSKEYTGNLKLFLDNAMRKINLEWNQYEESVNNEYRIFNLAIERLKGIFGDFRQIGRWLKSDTFNRNLFDVKVLYFSIIPESNFESHKNDFLAAYRFLAKQETFISTLQAGTTSKKNYESRFTVFEQMINKVFHTHFHAQYFNLTEK
ncbi:MAG: DUF262 domain-containing protein [Bacteroidia bacterium]